MTNISDLYKQVKNGEPRWGDREVCDLCKERARWAFEVTAEDDKRACDEHLTIMLSRESVTRVVPLPDPVGIEAMKEAVDDG